MMTSSTIPSSADGPSVAIGSPRMVVPLRSAMMSWTGDVVGSDVSKVVVRL